MSHLNPSFGKPLRRAAVSLFVVGAGLLGPSALPAAAAGGLVLTISDSPDPVASAGALTYTLHVANPLSRVRVCEPGDQGGKPYCYWEFVGTDVSGVSVSDTLPSAVAYQSAAADSNFSCTQSGGIVSCVNGAIAAGATATIAIKVQAPTLAAGGTNLVVTNSASVTPGGSSATAGTTVTAPPPVYTPTLTLRGRIQGPTSVALNQTVTYQAYVDNLGSVPASNLETWFQTAVPTRLMNLNPNGWGCYLPTGYFPRLGIDCNGGNVGAYATAGYTIDLTFNATGCAGVSLLLDPNNTQPAPKNLINTTIAVCVS